MFFFSKSIISKIGTTYSILLALTALSLRCALYTALDESNVQLVVFVELLHGVCFSTAWSAAVKVASQIAPKGCESLSQGILNCIFSGLGPAIGMLGGGVVYRAIGPHAMWWCLAAINLFVALTFWIVSSWEDSWRQRAAGFSKLEDAHDTKEIPVREKTKIEMIQRPSIKAVALDSEFFKDGPDQSVASLSLPPLAPPGTRGGTRPATRAASRNSISGLVTRPTLMSLKSTHLTVLLSSQSSLHHPHNLNTMTPAAESRGNLFGGGDSNNNYAPSSSPTRSRRVPPMQAVLQPLHSVTAISSSNSLPPQLSTRSSVVSTGPRTGSIAELSRRSSWSQKNSPLAGGAGVSVPPRLPSTAQVPAVNNEVNEKSLTKETD
ncbi:hypothetical protein HDU93_001062 [Gonapodya sp. JEL0774]|nr:hypothetical protein HDU93_001062 [Gonapodya sp. JEL0774]